ncbi:MAG: hypothetical protein HFH59_07895 [Lachnospiraceae bacterium]|nr:hypothetical protein [Lachnospiraceae bacterium]
MSAVIAQAALERCVEKGMGVFRRIGIIPLAAARRRRRILLCMILFYGGGFGETSNQDICA